MVEHRKKGWRHLSPLVSLRVDGWHAWANPTKGRMHAPLLARAKGEPRAWPRVGWERSHGAFRRSQSRCDGSRAGGNVCMPSEELRGVAMRYYSSFSCSSLFLLHRNFRPSADEPDLTKRERDGRMRGRRTRGEGESHRQTCWARLPSRAIWVLPQPQVPAGCRSPSTHHFVARAKDR